MITFIVGSGLLLIGLSLFIRRPQPVLVDARAEYKIRRDVEKEFRKWHDITYRGLP